MNEEIALKTESNKIASNTMIQIIGRILVIAMALVSTKFITNYLGPSGNGYYTTIITYLSFFIVLADFGLFSVGVREISKNKENTKKILSNIFLVRIISALIAVVIAVSVIFLTGYSPEIKYGVLIAALLPIFNLSSSVFDMFFQSRLEMEKVAIAEVISKVFALVAVIIAITLNLGFYYIVGTVSLAAVLNFFIKWAYSANKIGFSIRYDKEILPSIVKMAIPLGIVFLVNNVYFKIDSLLLFYFKGAAEVGIYAVAYRVLETTLFAGSYLSSSLKPLLSVSVDNDKEKAQRTLGQAFVFLLFMALAITIICVTFSKEIILFLSNAEFVSGASATVILGFAPIFIYLSGMMGEVMIAKDMRKSMLAISSFILCFNVAINIILIPRYGFVGAAYSTLVSEVVLLTISWLATRRHLKFAINVWQVIKLIFIALIISCLGFFLKTTGLYFIVNILLLFVLYAAFCYWLQAIPKQTVQNYLLSIKSRWIN